MDRKVPPGGKSYKKPSKSAFRFFGDRAKTTFARNTQN